MVWPRSSGIDRHVRLRLGQDLVKSEASEEHLPPDKSLSARSSRPHPRLLPGRPRPDQRDRRLLTLACDVSLHPEVVVRYQRSLNTDGQHVSRTVRRRPPVREVHRLDESAQPTPPTYETHRLFGY